MVALDQVATLHELVQLARKRLARGAWDYLVGGSETETTLARNRLAIDRLALRPRVCVDVRRVDPYLHTLADVQGQWNGDIRAVLKADPLFADRRRTGRRQ